MSGLYEHGLLCCKVLARFVIASIIDYFSFLIVIPPPPTFPLLSIVDRNNKFIPCNSFVAISKECAGHSSVSESPGRRKSQTTTKPGCLFICCELSYSCIIFHLKTKLFFRVGKRDRKKNVDLDKDMKRSADVILFKIL